MVENSSRHEKQQQSGPAISIDHLKKNFRVGFWGRKVEAVKDVSLEVRSNEIFGFLGPNGAGKTTTIKSILRLIYPTGGEVKIFGEPSQSVSVRSRIGFLPENPYFYDYLTAEEFMNFYGQLLGLDKRTRAERSSKLLEQVGLENRGGMQLRKFSKGMVQRIGLAQALLNDPDLVILDEPMSGLDPLGRKEIRDIILELKKEGKTVFFSTHILPDVEMICDRVGIIRSGEIVAVGALSDILQTRTHGVEIIARGVRESDISGMGIEKHVSRGDSLMLTLGNPQEVDKVIKAIIDKGGSIVEVSPRRESLESYFVKAFEKGGNRGGGEPS